MHIKKTIFNIILLFSVNLSFGQVCEIGGFFGTSNYIGDVGSNYFTVPNTLAGGFVFKYNLNTRIALRLNYMYLDIKADDSNAGTSYKVFRNVKFKNKITEIGIGTEFNFKKYNHLSIYTPYILYEVAIFGYRTPKELKGRTLLNKSSLGLAIPIGVGFKGRITGELAYAVETGVRLTFKDDIDYSTNKIKALDYGGQRNDYYMFTGVSLVYTFGRQACYTDSIDKRN